MAEDLAQDETVLLTTYANWNDAEIARAYLEDEGVTALVVGQEPHRGPEFAEGVRLRVLSAQVERALELLENADLLPNESVRTDEPDEGGSNWSWIVGMATVIIALAIVAFLYYS